MSLIYTLRSGRQAVAEGGNLLSGTSKARIVSFRTEDTYNPNGRHGGKLIEDTLSFLLSNVSRPNGRPGLSYTWSNDLLPTSTKQTAQRTPKISYSSLNGSQINLYFPKDGITRAHSGKGFILNYFFGQQPSELGLLHPKNRISRTPLGKLHELNISMRDSDTGNLEKK